MREMAEIGVLTTSNSGSLVVVKQNGPHATIPILINNALLGTLASCSSISHLGKSRTELMEDVFRFVGFLCGELELTI